MLKIILNARNSTHKDCFAKQLMISVPCNELRHGVSYFIHEGTGELHLASRKYRGVHMMSDHDANCDMTFMYFRGVYFVNKALHQYQGANMLVDRHQDGLCMYRFYQDSWPLLETALRRRMLVELGLPEEVIDAEILTRL